LNNEPNREYFPSLETDRLKLQPLAAEDTNFIYRLLTDPRVAQYTMDIPPATHEQARDLIKYYLGPEGATENRWGLFHKEDGRYIGAAFS